MKDSVLFSIIVPTKNRYEYLIPLIDLVESFCNEQIELVVQDNSDDNAPIMEFMENRSFVSLRYFYDNSHLSVVQNSDLAIMHSSGKYITFLGDDDFLSNKAFSFVVEMDRRNIESAIFNVALYNWPGIQHVAHKFPNLMIKRFKGSISYIDVKREYQYLLNSGAASLGKMPKVYHGIIRRDCLDAVFERANTYFPGPSPDMANSVALSKVVSHHIYCDVPYISAGASPKSTAGLGAKHKHIGKLSEMDFLPIGVEERWNDLVPKVWTAPTIYAQSFTEAVKAMGCKEDLNAYNYNYLYASFWTFCPEFRDYFKKEKNKYKVFNQLLFEKNRVRIFFVRLKHFLNNSINTKLKKGAILVDGVQNTIEASAIVDNYLESIELNKLFNTIEEK